MEEEPPQPDDPARDHTAAQQKRPRNDSKSSTSADTIESTRTLASDDLEFIKENGRIYGNDTYFMPCDQAEQDRLTILHQVFVHALEGKLTTTKITPMTRRILDLGTGPGHWAVAMAQQYPHTDVVGVDMAVWDLETTEGEFGADRVTWQIDDLDVWGLDADLDEVTFRLENYSPFRNPTARNLSGDTPMSDSNDPQQHKPPSTSEAGPSFNPYVLESEAQPGWHFSQPFDLIHLRNLAGSFAYWEDVYAEIYKNLAPGGCVEVADLELLPPEMTSSIAVPGQSTDGTSKAKHDQAAAFLPALRKLYLAGMQASYKSGRPLGTFYMHPTYLEDAGFKDVRTTSVNVPVGQWPEDEKQKKIGKMFLVTFMECLEAFSLRLLTKHGDQERLWTAEEVRETVEAGKKEILEWSEGFGGEGRREGWCANFKWIVGRKSKNA